MLLVIFIISSCFTFLNASDIVKNVPKLGQVFTSQQADVNASFQIFCSVRQGAQPLFFEWFKNSKPIRQGPGIRWQIENSKLFSTLMIERIAKEDTGNYSCLVKNIYGSDSINVKLTVKGMEKISSLALKSHLSAISMYGAIDTVNSMNKLR